MATLKDWENDVKEMSIEKLKRKQRAIEELLAWKRFDEEYGRGYGIRILRDIVKEEVNSRR